jgi:hypothetical protein
MESNLSEDKAAEQNNAEDFILEEIGDCLCGKCLVHR